MVKHVSATAWQEIHLTTRAPHVDWLSDELSARGALAFTLQDNGDQPIYEPTPNQAAPLWPEVKVVVLFAGADDLQEVTAFLTTQQTLQVVGAMSHHVLPDEDWERRCLDQLEPMRFGQRLWICPSWLTPPDPTAINLILDPGLAFGTGTHPTTALCLEWLEENCTVGARVVDYGCGSGILGLAALKLGAAHVLAIDHDDKALQATSANAVQNEISPAQLTTCLPNVQTIDNIDLLIANILAQPLIELAPKLSAMVKLGGKILLSGILKDQIESVKAAYAPWFNMQAVDFKGDWARLTGIR